MKTIHLFLLLGVLLCSCNKSEETVTAPLGTSVDVTVSGLPPLTEGGAHYEVWAAFVIFSKSARPNSPLHDSAFVSLGEFNIAADGHMIGVGTPTPEFSIPSGQDPQLLDKVVITVQTEPDSGIARILHGAQGGAIVGGLFAGSSSQAVANLDMSFADAFGTNFSTVTGKYTITAPTSIAADSNSGVWFYDPGPPPSASLTNLPTLEDEWTYEGWVIDKTDSLHWKYYSTGKFVAADSADFDGAGRNSGPGTGLNFPGQDFIVSDSTLPSRPNLLNGQYGFRITIEPVPDNSPNPFFLTLLSSDPTPVPRPRGTAQSFTMFPVHPAPTGRVIVER